MTKFFTYFLIIFTLFTITKTNAIEWIDITTPSGKHGFLDIDSIKKKDKYYFYNIKFRNNTKDPYNILTIQSGLHNAYSARIKLYSEEEYSLLGGNYENITLNSTQNLEPAVYGSLVYTCHKKVRELMEKKEIPLITLE